MSSEPAEAPRRASVQSVDRALDVLEALGHGTPMGVSELVRETGLPLGTVHRLLATLTERGYARQDSERKYAVGPSALRLADASEQALAAVGRPYAARLTALCGETTNLAVLQGSEMVYIAQSPSPHSLRIFAEVGRRVPLHSTAVGKAVLSTMPEAQALALVSSAPMPATTTHTITTLPGMSAELRTVAAQGFAMDEQEQEIGVRCVAAAIPSSTGLYAALSVSGPTERFTHEAVRAVEPQVRAIAAELGEALRP